MAAKKTARTGKSNKTAGTTAPIDAPDSTPMPPDAARRTTVGVGDKPTAPTGRRAGPSQTSASGPQASTQEEIARFAYFRWIDRGGAHGHDVEDWIETERALQRA